jgi:hypothetical protein
MGEPVRESVELGVLADGMADGTVRRIDSRAKVDSRRRSDRWTTWVGGDSICSAQSAEFTTAAGRSEHPTWQFADEKSVLHATKSILAKARQQLLCWPVFSTHCDNLQFRWSIQRHPDPDGSVVLSSGIEKRVQQGENKNLLIIACLFSQSLTCVRGQIVRWTTELNTAVFRFFHDGNDKVAADAAQARFLKALNDLAAQRGFLEIVAGALGAGLELGDLDTLLETLALGAQLERSGKLFLLDLDQSCTFVTV